MPETEQTQQCAFRLPVKLLEDLDKHAAQLSKNTGMNVTRTDALRTLLRSALLQEKRKAAR